MMSSYFLILASALAAGVVAQADTPMVEFDCTNVPNVCANMCWGAYCTDQGGGAIGVTLSYDAPSPETTQARYNAACVTPTNGNRCNGGPANANSCDEYPFKTTSDADLDDAVSKCQGGTLGNFYPTLDASNGPVEFIIVFGNPGDASYCEYPPTCTNDGSIYQNGGPAPNPSTPPSRKRFYYMSKAGKEILSPVELQPGKKFMSMFSNKTMVAEGKSFEEASYPGEDEILYHLFTL